MGHLPLLDLTSKMPSKSTQKKKISKSPAIAKKPASPAVSKRASTAKVSAQKAATTKTWVPRFDSSNLCLDIGNYASFLKLLRLTVRSWTYECVWNSDLAPEMLDAMFENSFDSILLTDTSKVSLLHNNNK